MPVFNNALAGAAGQSGGAAAGYKIERSLRFNQPDSAYLNRTPSSAGNRRTWTLSVWCKKAANGIYMPLINANNSTNPYLNLSFTNSDTIRWLDGSNQGQVLTDAVFRDNSAWYHIVCATDTTLSTATDRVKIYVNGVRQDVTFPTTVTQNHQTQVNNTTEHRIGRWLGTSSLYLNGYLADYYLIDGQALDPTSFGAFDDNGVWQPAAYSGSFGTNGFHLFDFANESGIGNDSSGNNNDFTANNLVATAQSVSVSDVTVYRDGAVYALGNPAHMFDSNKATTTYAGSNNATNYIDWSPTGGYETSGHIWIQGGNGSGGGADSMTVTINGSTVTRTAVVDNETYGSPSYGYGDWHKYTVSGNTLNSLRLTGAYALIRQLSTVDDPTHSVLGISDDSDVPIIENVDPAALDILFDVPTNGTQSDTGAGGEVSGNYATLNPNITGTYINSRTTLSQGNLKFVNSHYSTVPSTIAMSSGKWYCEGTLDALASSDQVYAGLLRADAPNNAYEYFQGNNPTRGVHYWGDNTGLNRAQTYGVDYGTAGTVIGIAFDADAGSCTWYVNGSSQGASTYSIVQGEEYYFSFGAYTNGSWTVNFGQRPFTYSAPSGYKALCTTNLPTPTIADGSDYFEAKTYTGNGSSQSITTSFSPDWVWIKQRNSAADHNLFDIVRGVQKRLFSNSTSAEGTISSGLTAFNSDGWTMGSSGNINGSSNTYVGWAWDAGSSTVSNTDGSITSSVRANPTAGFSIVSWTHGGSTGDVPTIGHGLNAEPKLILAKSTSNTQAWKVYHSSIGVNKSLRLDNDSAASTVSTPPAWSVSNSTFGASTGYLVSSGYDYIAYCFAPVAGYSAFGSYKGNGTNNYGPFVYTGFRPAWVMIKNTITNTTRWMMYDSVRETTNEITNRLRADRSEAQYSDAYNRIDFLSNGFKIRGTAGTDTNQNGNTFIYLAFAENPFQTNGGLAR
jgi:hypothetical protein